jgi:hypothetical protein
MKSGLFTGGVKEKTRVISLIFENTLGNNNALVMLCSPTQLLNLFVFRITPEV